MLVWLSEPRKSLDPEMANDVSLKNERQQDCESAAFKTLIMCFYCNTCNDFYLNLPSDMCPPYTNNENTWNQHWNFLV